MQDKITYSQGLVETTPAGVIETLNTQEHQDKHRADWKNKTRIKEKKPQ